MALGLGTVFDNRSMNRVLCPVAIARRILFLLAPLEMLAKKNNPTRGPEDLHLAGDRSAYRWRTATPTFRSRLPRSANALAPKDVVQDVNLSVAKPPTADTGGTHRNQYHTAICGSGKVERPS
uniref:Uncharacterized protein n=1 Tax=Anopheles coluzzii TaxID=1518534 RepID=A0A8W7PUQ8_ANOCL